MDLYEFLGKFKNLPDGVEKRLHHHFVHSSIEVAKQWKNWCNERVGKNTRKTCTYDEAIFLADTFAEEIASSSPVATPEQVAKETAWAALENSVNSYGYQVRYFRSVAEMSELCAFWPDAHSVWVSGGNRPDHVHCTWTDPARLQSNFGFVFFETGTELDEAASVAAMRFAADHHDRRSDGDYGRSVMMYQVAKSGSYRSLKSRWNHAANCGPHCDHIFDDDLNVAIGEGVQSLMDSFLSTLGKENSFTPLLHKTPGAKGKFIRLNPGYNWGPDGTRNWPINPDKEIVVSGEILSSGLQPEPEDSETITAFGFREIRRVFLNNPKAVVGKPDCIVVLPENSLTPDFNGNAIEIDANGFITGIWLPFATEIEDMFCLDVGTDSLRNLHIGSARVIRNSFNRMSPCTLTGLSFTFTNVETIENYVLDSHLFRYQFGTETFPMVSSYETFSCAAHAWMRMPENHRQFYELRGGSIIPTARWTVKAEDCFGKLLMYLPSVDYNRLTDTLSRAFYTDGTNPDPWSQYVDDNGFRKILFDLGEKRIDSFSLRLENGIKIRVIKDDDAKKPVECRAIRRMLPGCAPMFTGKIGNKTFHVKISENDRYETEFYRFIKRSDDKGDYDHDDYVYRSRLARARERNEGAEYLLRQSFCSWLDTKGQEFGARYPEVTEYFSLRHNRQSDVTLTARWQIGNWQFWEDKW